MTTTYTDGNPNTGMGQTQQCGSAKPHNMIFTEDLWKFNGPYVFYFKTLKTSRTKDIISKENEWENTAKLINIYNFLY